jgi:hypothetical protein
VAYAAQQQYRVNVGEMRDIEGHLFGRAGLENDRNEKGEKVAARRSEVRIRLSRWDEGKLKSWQAANKINHPEVGMVDSNLYLGYGPVVVPKGSREPSLNAKAAIQAKEPITPCNLCTGTVPWVGATATAGVLTACIAPTARPCPTSKHLANASPNV